MGFLALTIIIGAVFRAPLAFNELQHRQIIMMPQVTAGFAAGAVARRRLCHHILVGHRLSLSNLAVEQIVSADGGQVMNMQPVFGTILATLLLGEPFHADHWAGIGLIIVGIGISFVRRASSARAVH